VVSISTCWSWPARRSHLRPIWTLDITNSIQFDGQAFWPVVWRFPASWMLVHSHHCHLKTTRALKHVRQTLENSPKKSRPVNHWQWHTHGLLVQLIGGKSVPCHLVRTRPVFANLVIFDNVINSSGVIITPITLLKIKIPGLLVIKWWDWASPPLLTNSSSNSWV